ncbi:hypothetical protein BGZ94_006105, partial [Podila epigama]
TKLLKLTGLLGAILLATYAAAAPVSETEAVDISPRAQRIVFQFVHTVKAKIKGTSKLPFTEWSGTIGAKIVIDDVPHYHHLNTFKGVKEFNNKTCFDRDLYCVKSIDRGDKCDVELWIWQRHFSYKGVGKVKKGDEWSCSMTWLG